VATISSEKPSRVDIFVIKDVEKGDDTDHKDHTVAGVNISLDRKIINKLKSIKQFNA